MPIPGIPARAANPKLNKFIGKLKFVSVDNKLIIIRTAGPPIPDFIALKIGCLSFKVLFTMYKTIKIPMHKTIESCTNVKVVTSPIFYFSRILCTVGYSFFKIYRHYFYTYLFYPLPKEGISTKGPEPLKSRNF